MSESSQSRSKRPGEKVLTINGIDTTFLTETLKNGLLKIDEEGNLRLFPVVIVDPTSNPVRMIGSNKYNSGAITTGNLSVNVWGPPAGKRFNIIGIHIEVSASVAEAALDDSGISLLDGASGTICILACTIPAVSIATGSGGHSIDITFGNAGYRSLLPGNILTMTITANLTAGRISCLAWGFESL